MTPVKIMALVLEDFDISTATNVVAASALLGAIKITKKDLSQPNHFTIKFEKKLKDLLLDVSLEEFQLVLKVLYALHSYEVQESLGGIGENGEDLTLKELVESMA